MLNVSCPLCLCSVGKRVDSHLEIAKTRYQAGIIAFENGQYKEAVEQLEKASALLVRNSRLGGEVQIWLATAYEAAGRNEEAIALCEQLKRHPDLETNKESRRLQYIFQAPKLQRPKEWMTEIPDLATLPDNQTKIRLTAKTTKSSVTPEPTEPKFDDLTQINTRDNRFIWVALIAISFTIVTLVWYSF